MKTSLSFFIYLIAGIFLFSCTKDESNEPQPTDIELSANTLDENEPINTVIGQFTTIDPGAVSHTYSLVAGDEDDDNASFIIEGNQLKSNAVFDFETKSTFLIRVRTTNESVNSYEKVFTIYINDITEVENITGNYFFEFNYSFSGPGITGTSNGTISSVSITQSGNNIQVRGNPGTIDVENHVLFSGDFIDTGTQNFDGDYYPSDGTIAGNLSGNIEQGFFNGQYWQTVLVTITSGTCTLTPLK